MADTQQRNPFTLFELRDEIKTIIGDIIEAEIAGDKDEVDALHAELDGLYDARESKHEGYVYVIKNSLSGAENHQAVSDDFAKRARALKNLAKRLKDRLLEDMKLNGEEAVPAGIFKIARQTNSVPSLILDIDAEDLPGEFQIITVDADNDALRQALKAGEKIEGAKLEKGEHVRIKVR